MGRRLSLVEPAQYDPLELPAILTDPAARKQFETLTQRLVEVVIEIMDIADGDPDLEPAGDESEDSDGI